MPQPDHFANGRMVVLHQPIESTDERRAAHEAGHSLIACVVDWQFDYATIDPDPEYPGLNGHVRYVREIDRSSTFGDLKSCIAAFLGGRYGELVLIGDAGPGSKRDEQTVVQLINDYYLEGQRMRVYAEASQFVTSVIRDSGDSLAAIQAALLERRRLNWDEVGAIVRATAGPEVQRVLRGL